MSIEIILSNVYRDENLNQILFNRNESIKRLNKQISTHKDELIKNKLAITNQILNEKKLDQSLLDDVGFNFLPKLYKATEENCSTFRTSKDSEVQLYEIFFHKNYRKLNSHDVFNYYSSKYRLNYPGVIEDWISSDSIPKSSRILAKFYPFLSIDFNLYLISIIIMTFVLSCISLIFINGFNPLITISFFILLWFVYMSIILTPLILIKKYFGEKIIVSCYRGKFNDKHDRYFSFLEYKDVIASR